jgi:uroporphyrinogen III methyltransferase/synthase
VDVVEAYRTLAPENLAAKAAEALARKPHAITFTSSSTVKNFVAAAGASALAGIDVVSIGPVTSRTARDLGVKVAAQADVYTVEGLLDALVGLYR